MNEQPKAQSGMTDQPDDPDVTEAFKWKRLRFVASVVVFAATAIGWICAHDKQEMLPNQPWAPWLTAAVVITGVICAAVVALDWTCPACSRRLGQAYGIEFCSKCGVRLVKRGGGEASRRSGAEAGSGVGPLAFRRGSAQPADPVVIEAVKRIKGRHHVVSVVSVALLSLNIYANGKTFPAMPVAVEQIMKHAVFGAFVILMAEFFFDWKCPKCKCRLSNLYGEFCGGCGIRLMEERSPKG